MIVALNVCTYIWHSFLACWTVITTYKWKLPSGIYLYIYLYNCTECMYLRLASIIGILPSHAGQWKLSAANNSFNSSEVFADCLVRCSSSPLGINSLAHSGQEWDYKINIMTSYQANILFWAMENHISHLTIHIQSE